LGSCQRLVGKAETTYPQLAKNRHYAHDRGSECNRLFSATKDRIEQSKASNGGTTNLRIASFLSREHSATIVTNSPPLALALADHPKLSVLMLGGNFLKEARVTTGIETIRRVESIRADLCFLGMCSLHPEVGITVGDREEAYVKQAMIGASTEVVGLISLGKMGTSLPYLVGPASRLTRLITDASDEDVLNPYRSQGIEVTST